MRLPSEIQFHQDIGLLIYRSRGLIGETALNSVIRVIEDLEAATQEPFDRFSDTLGTDEFELNVLRSKSAYSKTARKQRNGSRCF